MRFFSKESKRTILLLCCCLLLFFISEFFLFNQVLSISSNLEEKTLTVNDGFLHQFQTLDESIISTGSDPSVLFENVNLRISEISLNCDNSIPETDGQVFFRGKNEPYSESKSFRYENSSETTTIILDETSGFGKAPFVSGLRFDLTDTPGDIVTCESFVIKSPRKLNINVARLSIYLFVLLFVMKFPSKLSKFSLLFMSVFYVGLLVLTENAVKYKTLGITLIFLLILSYCVSYSLMFVLGDKGDEPFSVKSYVNITKNELLIAFLIFIISLPLITNNFYYYDDWYIYGSEGFTSSAGLMEQGRPLLIILYSIFTKNTLSMSYLIRLFYLPGLILLAITLFRFIDENLENQKLSFVVVGFLFLSNTSVDFLGYASTSPAIFAYLFCVIGFVSLEKRIHTRARKIEYLPGLILIISSTLIYQLSGQILMFMLFLELFSHRRDFIDILRGLSIFVGVNGFYLLFTKLLPIIYPGVSLSSRSTLVSINEIPHKLRFFQSVLKQLYFQIINNLSGGALFSENYRGYYLTPIQNFASIVHILLWVMIALTVSSLYFLYAKRGAKFLGFVPITIFGSYFAFLILKENGYLNYYAFPLYGILVFSFIYGLFFIVINKPRTFLLFILMLVILLVSSYQYAQRFYVQYNQAYYTFIKNSIITSFDKEKTHRIHIYGLISPINADIYNEFVTRHVLEELGLDENNIAITYSSTKGYLSRIQENEFNAICGKISVEDKAFLIRHYSYYAGYNQYTLISVPGDPVELERLKGIFITSKVLPDRSDESTIIIDISWTSSAYFKGQLIGH
ncbi:MAG: hypothetical protein GXY10_06980 [Clostridiales bacterium]|nr:hypothetical protein [Clostridiales bacterium]